MNNKGTKYERLAEKHLLKNGLKLIARNYSCRLGEIDLIMRDHHAIVFVEVRYRKTDTFGSAQESINNTKQAKLVKTALLYMQQHKLFDSTCRFDTVTFDTHECKQPINWIKSAFGAPEYQ